ncbi:MAG: hypothetical protein R2746_10490 [Acidimicrobiales bacterium]|nr:hypothetical protein [Actinomycetota bacterium]
MAYVIALVLALIAVGVAAWAWDAVLRPDAEVIHRPYPWERDRVDDGRRASHPLPASDLHPRRPRTR